MYLQFNILLISFKSNILSGWHNKLAIPTFVEKIGVFVREHSLIARGPPSTLLPTIYKSRQLYNSFNNLLQYVRLNFPAAAINVLSLIPRRLADAGHLSRMMCVNEYMRNTCTQYNCRFVDIFTHFLSNSRQFIHNGEMILIEKLYYPDDMIHFSDVGYAVYIS